MPWLVAVAKFRTPSARRPTQDATDGEALAFFTKLLRAPRVRQAQGREAARRGPLCALQLSVRCGRSGDMAGGARRARGVDGVAHERARALRQDAQRAIRVACGRASDGRGATSTRCS